MLNKLLLVQPHSDDILFSCSHPLFSPDYEVQVLTIENDEKRIAEDQKLYEFLNIPFHHLTVPFKDESYYAYYKESKQRDMETTSAIQCCEEYFGEDVLEQVQYELLRFMYKFWETEGQEDYEIVAPLGIAHPFHCWVSEFLSTNDIAKYFYREWPHSYKKRAKKQLESASSTFKLHEEFNSKEFHDIKFELAKKFYKSQSGLLFFEQGYVKKRLNEEIYVKR